MSGQLVRSQPAREVRAAPPDVQLAEVDGELHDDWSGEVQAVLRGPGFEELFEKLRRPGSFALPLERHAPRLSRRPPASRRGAGRLPPECAAAYACTSRRPHARAREDRRIESPSGWAASQTASDAPAVPSRAGCSPRSERGSRESCALRRRGLRRPPGRAPPRSLALSLFVARVY